jgi:hypothetical protein
VFVNIKLLNVSVFYHDHLQGLLRGGPPEDGREKRPKHVGVLYFANTFLNILFVLNVKVSVY